MQSRHLKLLVAAALVSTSLIGLSAPAFAQDAAAQAQPSKPATDTASANSDANAIIVTARRRKESLQTTPVAITAITASSLDSRASTNIGDLQGAAPGLLITQQNSGAQAANLSIRGLTYADIEKSQTPTVGVVVDGVMIGTNTGQLQDVFDIAQIEVLRGPQGTLFGANTIGGVISIERTKPTMQTGAKLEFSYGQWNTWSGKGIVNLGNGSSWGLKLWYYHNQTDGYYINTNTNTRTGGSQDDSYGGSLLFKPLGSNFDAQFTLENLDQSFVPVNVSLTQKGEAFYGVATPPANLYQVSDLPTYATYHAPAATLRMNYDAGAVKLTSITGWRHSTEWQTQDFATAGLYYVLRQQNYTQWSQELRASGKISPTFDYVVGGFYFNSHYNFVQYTTIGGGDALLTSTNPAATAPGYQIEYAATHSYAGFGDFNWAFADKFRLSFGGRWTHDEKILDNGFQGAPFPNGDANFSKFTPKIGIDYRPDSNTMFYASFTRGYRSGGFSPRAGDAVRATTPFQPETLDSYEIGTKLDLARHMLQLNLAAFYSDYKNMQQNLTIPCGCATGNQTITGNVPGGALIKGIEADATWRPIEGLKFTATAAYTDSHFRNYVVSTGVTTTGALTYSDYSANNLIYAPKFSGSINGEYTLPTSFGKMVFTTGLRHISPYDEQISNGPTSAASTAADTIYLGNDPRVRTLTQNLVDASITANFKLSGADAYF
ncbi:MAG: TonB-dependent receptor, partial [Alphaproteobacteria bacterium]|nr:TonB-dependent receptor [Alphaproteobacteria bacterium]